MLQPKLNFGFVIIKRSLMVFLPNPHCKEAASEIPKPVENDRSTGQEQCKEDSEEDKKDSGIAEVIENKGAPEKHSASTVQESVENNLNPADSFNLIPDSLTGSW
ncbi:TPA: hypothetical protein ACTXE5_004689 [Raoultella ornithinolytica]